MDIVEAIYQRQSIRSFKPDPVPKEILEKIVESALLAPSWSNTQPWQFAIVSGNMLEKIKQAFIEKAGEQPDPDLPYPAGFPHPYDARRQTRSIKLFEIKGIRREDREKRGWWRLQGLGLFGAPSVIYIYIDRSLYSQADRLNVWPIFDCGLIAENIMLLAVEYGLGTIPQAQAVNYPNVIRDALGIPASKIIVLGISIGYPNWSDPINQFRSERESLDEVTKWYGFG